MTTDQPDKPKPRRRRWMRFGLRTLVVFVTLLCVGLGCLAWMLERTREQRRVIAWIESKGGGVSYDLARDLGGTSENWVLRNLVANSVVAVDLNGTTVSDVSHLAELEGLEWLSLYDTQVSNVSPLAGLEAVNSLNLSYTQVRDVSPLTGLEGLLSLFLSNTQVRDVSPLAGLEGLEVLDLSYTQVSDVSPLAELERLLLLDLSDTQVSKEDMDRLRQALPNCYIVSRQMRSRPPATPIPPLSE